MMIEQSILEITAELANARNIIIVPHKGPDGDAMGASLGLWHFLKDKGHNPQVIAPNNYPDFLKWLPGNDQVIVYENEEEHCRKLINDADLIFTLDFNELSRAGNMVEPLKAARAVFIMIDHHQEPTDYAMHTYSDAEMSSTCEMLYHFIEKLRGKNQITPEIATCIYTGIMTDTGSFRYSATSSLTHTVVADLIERGAQNTQIHNNVFDTNSENRLQLLGTALNNLKVIKEYNTAYISLNQEELDRNNFKKGDTEGFVNYGLSLKGIVLAVIFIENTQENIIKISFRSKANFDVNKFARAHFNGGGHINAAGGKSTISLPQTIKKFEEILPQYREELIS